MKLINLQDIFHHPSKLSWKNNVNSGIQRVKLCRKLHSGMLITFQKYKMGVTEFVLRYEQPKYGVFLQDFLVAMVTFYVTKMTLSFSAIISAFNHITLLLSDKVL